MTKFEDKFKEQFSNFNIDSIKEPSEAKNIYHIYADYIELLSLFSKDPISKSDISSRIGISENSYKEIEDEKLDGDFGETVSEIADKKESLIDILFDYLNERKNSLNNFYPFIIDKKSIKLKNENLNKMEQLYIFLLLSSSLKDFKKIGSILTTEFELISEYALKRYLPSNAIVRALGSSTYYKGNAKTKIEILAKELNVETKNRAIKQISDKNTKEEGLDIIGWIPFNDNNPNSIIILGQCACGKEWDGKQMETRRYENFLESYKHPFLHALFMPYLLSKKGRFEHDKDIVNDILIFERKRILELLNFQDLNNEKTLNFDKLIQECLKYKETDIL
ncbi:MAG: hypothetical protein U0457_07145 [Candidatus Sericytochromatia bacterium]